LPTGWGSVTRHGAWDLEEDGASASEIWREAARQQPARPARPAAAKDLRPERTPWAGEQARARAVRVGNELVTSGDRPSVTERGHEAGPGAGLADMDEEAATTALAAGTTAAGAGRSGRPAGRGAAGATKAGRKVGPARRVVTGRTAGLRSSSEEEAEAKRVTAKLADAARAYSADRYQDALRMLRKLSAQAHGSAAVKELLGLTLYRLARWPLALRELQEHHELSGSYDQFPVIADCYRAMHRYVEAEATWSELRQASPSPEVVAEGRLVAAGCLADQGDLRGAVKLLEASLRRTRPKPQRLRQWYALADLYERAGELPRARDIFSQIAAVDPDAYDVKQRLVALG
jgi:tetratricopeptide (TPR) repeat protein